MKPEEKLVRVKDVLEITGMSRSTIWRLVNSGDFPAPYKLGPRMNAWHKSEIVTWIESRRENQAA